MSIYSKTDQVILHQIGQFIKAERAQKNLSQQDLSDLSGVPRINISRIENDNNFNVITLIKLFRALEILNLLDFKTDQSTDEIKNLFKS